MAADKTPNWCTDFCRQKCKKCVEVAKLRGFGKSWQQENLRMSWHSFVPHCIELGPHIRKQVTRMRLLLLVNMQLAVTMWWLATNFEYRTILALFGLGISAICTIVNKTCSMISQHLLPKYVLMQREQKLKEVVDEFQNLCWDFLKLLVLYIYSYTYPNATRITIRLLRLERILLCYSSGCCVFCVVTALMSTLDDPERYMTQEFL